MTFDPVSGRSYTYDSENRLTSAALYDPLSRLRQETRGADARFAYDGLEPIGEYNTSNVLQKRTVFGPGVDEPLVEIDSAGTRKWLHADERGSIVAASDGSGNLVAGSINKYDEFGVPQSTNTGRFQYTGQLAYEPGVDLYHYKARTYSPRLGRFLQPDPIGYEDSPNLYAYVLNDPVNLIDPLGLDHETIVVRRKRVEPGPATSPGALALFEFQRLASLVPIGPNERCGSDECIIIVTGHRRRSSRVTIKLPPPRLPIPCNPTPNQLATSGEVRYQFTEGMLTRGLWSSHLEGTFVTTKGYSGRFETFASGMFFGKGTGVALGVGKSRSLATFVGTNYNIVGSLFPISISDNFSTGLSHVGQTDAGATPVLGIGATVSETKIRGVMCPP